LRNVEDHALSNSRAEVLFAKAGIPFDREPDWITQGQKPDFYCSGTLPFWCEVKNLERPEDSQRLSEAFHELGSRTSNLDLTGQGFAYIHEKFSHRDAKNVVHLLKRALKRFGDRGAASACSMRSISPTSVSIAARERSNCSLSCALAGAARCRFGEPTKQLSKLLGIAREFRNLVLAVHFDIADH
jgi:hypothetical protein